MLMERLRVERGVEGRDDETKTKTRRRRQRQGVLNYYYLCVDEDDDGREEDDPIDDTLSPLVFRVSASQHTDSFILHSL